MTQEQINISIAEHLGWFRHEDKFGGPAYWAIKENGLINIHVNGHPNYYGDLNSIHQVENLWVNNPDYSMELDTYLEWLSEICSPIFHNGDCSVFATAAQRCEAFLKTIGKWQD